MNIFTRTVCTMAMTSTFFIAGAEENKLVLNVSEPGTLKNLVTDEQATAVTDLTVSGDLNSTDIKFIRRLAGLDEYGDPVTGYSLENLDMSQANIVEGGEPYYFTTTTAKDIIGDYFFEYATQLKSIKIPESAKGIEYSAFDGCSNLTDFKVTDKVTYIDQAAFQGCTSLATVSFGKSLSEIDGYAFKDCTSLLEVILPQSLQTLDEFTFYNCSALKKASIPGSVKTIGQFAFSDDVELTDVSIENGVETIDQNAFAGCTALATIVVPNSVTEMGESVFDGCTSLSSVTLSENITSIAGGLLSNCENLQTVTIPDGVTSIGESAFLYDEKLETVNIPDGVTEIGDNAFFDCIKLKDITFGSALESLGEDVFKFCETLENVNVSADNEIYASVDGALYDKTVSKLIFLPPANTEEYIVPETVKELGENCAITNTKLKKLVISDNVETIGEGAFQTCENLENVTIGSGVQTAGDDVFFMDESIKEIHCRKTEPLEINKYFFWDVDYETCALYVPQNCSSVYAEANVWKDFKNIKEEGTTGIASAFEDNDITVYDINGNVVAHGANVKNKGTYIIRNGNKTYKVNM